MQTNGNSDVIQNAGNQVVGCHIYEIGIPHTLNGIVSFHGTRNALFTGNDRHDHHIHVKFVIKSIASDKSSFIFQISLFNLSSVDKL